VPDASQTTLLYQRLRVAILDLELAPGLRLTERWLETEFDASRTPVRAALARLESEGLAQRTGRSWMVSPIDLDELRALAEYREAVEVAVVRLACQRSDDAELTSLAAAQLAEEASPAGDEPAVPDFHLRLARLSGNPFLVAAMEGIMTRLSRTRWLEVRTPAASAQAASEHRAIVAAVEARDAVAATALVVAHIRSTGDRLAASLEGDRKRFTARGLSIVGSADARASARAATGARPGPRAGNAPAR
jgi:DNA-binding GntR family transcriptional regulator